MASAMGRFIGGFLARRGFGSAVVTRERNALTGILRMPVASKRCEAGSKTWKAAVSCVMISSPVARIAADSEGALHPADDRESPELGVRSRNRISSSPGENRGTPETVDVKFPAPPAKQTYCDLRGGGSFPDFFYVESREGPNFAGVPAGGACDATRADD